MKTSILATGLAMGVVLHAAAGPADSAALKPRFADPPPSCSTLPFWVWNEQMTDEQVDFWMRDFAAHGMKSVMVHPRPGLMTPYLSDEWFRLWGRALDRARELDMDIWIYDENSYPSGFAGGFVPEAMPDARAVNLVASTPKGAPAWEADTEAIFRIDGNRAEDIGAAVRAGKPAGRGPFLVISRKSETQKNAEWYGGWWYVDLLRPGVTEKFLDLTLEPYRKHFGAEFGKRIPGTFTDEPHVAGTGGLAWTPGLPALFERRWGYPLAPNYASLYKPVGDWRKVRHDYWRLILEQFIDRWAKPYHDWCEKNGMEFTGHYWEHEWPRCGHGPDSMAMYAWHQRPAIDILFNQYREDTGAQFGNVRALRELGSIARQCGRERTLCEAYGGAGWDLRFEDMKRIGDWLLVLGVNTLNQHLSHQTLRGWRKYDYPQSFSYQAPWWDAYREQAVYFARLTAALTAGRQVNEILVLEPTTTAWLAQPESSPETKAKLDDLGAQFMALLHALERLQVEYDLGSEDVLARRGSVKDGRLAVGACAYRAVVIPPACENLEADTLRLLEAYAAAGGRIVAASIPALVDGRPSDRPAALAKSAAWTAVTAEALPAAVAKLGGDAFAIERAAGDAGWLYHHRRQLDDGDLVFLVNTSAEAPSSGRIVARAGGAERWLPNLGTSEPCTFRTSETGRVEVPFELPPCGSALVFLPRAARPAVTEPARPAFEAVAPAGPMRIRRTGPAVLTLDYCDVTAAGETRAGAPASAAADFVFQKHGLPKNPWSGATQFRDRTIAKTFPAGSGFTATYRFTIEGAVPRPLHVAVERPELYTLECNGRPVAAKKGDWWMDRAFGRVDVSDAAKEGANVLVLKAAPLTVWHEVAPAYVLGDFGLRAAEKGFVIVPDRAPALGAWNAQGWPLYGGAMAYAQDFVTGARGGRWEVEAGAWTGSVAEVRVNGAHAGWLAERPWRVDVGGAMREGTNTVEVIVIGTPKNTMGPHHAGVLRGIASPGHFTKAPASGPPPGAAYDTIGYGLFEPFRLQRAKE